MRASPRGWARRSCTAPTIVRPSNVADVRDRRFIVSSSETYSRRRSHQSIARVRADAPLGAVCVELCDARWNATISAPRICENEYQVALEAAQSVGVDTLQLVDQPIGTTVSRAAELLRETAFDAVSLAGWRRIVKDCQFGLEELRADGGGLAWQDAYLDPRLLAASPIAIVRYLISSPSTATLLTLTLITLNIVLGAISVDESVIGLPERFAEVGLILVFFTMALRVLL